MESHSRFLVALAAGFVAFGAAQAPARAEDTTGQETPTAGRRMALDACVALALEQNVDVLDAAQQVSESEAARKEVRGEFGPKLHVDASAQQWTEPYNIPFSLGAGAPSIFPVHDAFVWNATVTLSQPITGLLAIYDAYGARAIGVDIAAIKHEVARQDTALRAIEVYYRLLQSERIADVAKASVDQLQSQLRQANSFHDNGVVSKDDVLRAQLAVANAQQRLIQARSRVAVGGSELAAALGLSPDEPVDPAPVPDDPPAPAVVLSFELGVRAGESQRVELTEVDKRLALAGKEVDLAWAKLAPQVTAVASYIHNEGSLFSQLNSAYVGAVASWDVWDWGTSTSAVSEAKARVRRAEIARRKVDEQIRLEVKKALLDVDSASQALAIARASVTQAEEEFGLVKKRYEANAATSFDVIDAEGLLTQARGQLATARYDELIARAALRRAMGVPADRLARQ